MTTLPQPDPITRHGRDGEDRAMDGRHTLSVAEGILIALRRYGQTDAFDELLRVAQRHHLSVLAVAHALVDLATNAYPPLGSPDRHADPTASLAEWESRLV